MRVSRLQPLDFALPSAQLLHLPMKVVVVVVAAAAVVVVVVVVEAARAGGADLAKMQLRSALRKLFSTLDDCDALGALELLVLVLVSASECTPKHTNSVHHLLPLSGAQIALTQRWLDDLPAVAVFELEHSVLLLLLDGSKCLAVAAFGDCGAEPLLDASVHPYSWYY